MRIATANYFARSLANLQDRQGSVDRAQMELSTGKQIILPSDDPTGANSILRLNKEIDISNRYMDAQDSAERYNLTTESTLSSMTDIIFRAEELLIQSINGTNDASSLSAIADELQQRLDQFYALANTKNANGDYIFSGYQTDTTTYEKDDFGFTQYEGDDGQREVLIAAGFQVKLNDPGSLFLENVPSESASYIPTANPANVSTSSISMGFVTHQAEYENTTHSTPYTVNFIAGAAVGEVRVEVLDSGGVAVPLEPNKAGFMDIEPGDVVEFNGIEFSTQDNPAPVAGDSFELEESSETSIMWTLQRAIDAMSFTSSSYVSTADDANTSTAVLTGGNINDAENDYLVDDFTVNILAGGLYEVYSSSGDLVEGPNDYTASNLISFEGVEFEVAGTPDPGDVFHIDRPNSDIRTDLVGALLTELKSGATSIDATRSEIGARLNVVEVEMSAQYRFQEITVTALANIEEVDIYAAITNLETSTVGLQAAQQSFAKVQNLSLFNYL